MRVSRVRKLCLIGSFELNNSFGSGKFGASIESIGFLVFCVALTSYWPKIQDINTELYFLRLVVLLGFWRGIQFFIIRLCNTVEADRGTIVSTAFNKQEHVFVISVTTVLRIFLNWIWILPTLLVFELQQFIDFSVGYFISLLVNLISLLLSTVALMNISARFDIVRAAINSFLPMLLLMTPVIWVPMRTGMEYFLLVNPLSVLILNLEGTIFNQVYVDTKLTTLIILIGSLTIYILAAKLAPTNILLKRA